MSDIKEILVPDIGADEVDVTEILVAVGDTIEEEQGLISVEGDKASMEVPAPFGGVVKEIKVAVGDKVSEGTLIITVEAAGGAPAAEAPAAQEAPTTPAPEAPAPAAAAPAGASQLLEITVPDIGADEVDVTEILVAVGDTIEEEQGLISVEGDKASMEVPAPFGGVVKEIKVAVGDKVSEGTLIVVVESGSAAAEAPAAQAAPAPVAEPAPAAAPSAASTTELKEVHVPDIGGDEVEVTELLVSVGDTIEEEAGLLTVEGDKASMEVPAPFAGVVKELKINVGDKVSEGTLVAVVEVTVAGAPAPAHAAPAPVAAAPAPAQAAPQQAAPKPPPVPHHPSAAESKGSGTVHASPSVRRLAREFGVDLTKVKGSGRKARIIKEDVQAYVKYELSRPKATATTSVGGGNGLQVVKAPKVDFSKFGEIETVEMSRIQKISGPALHRNWVTIPHVTQFDEADITELEAFRQSENAMNAKIGNGIKISPLIFIIKAVAKALELHPKFNTSLAEDGEHIIYKKYINIGVAVDTPNGLVVPVVKDANRKGIHELSRDLAEISKKARDGKLTGKDMQGGSLSISSLGGIGGTQFTPIVNAPEVAILGVSKSEMKPKWNGKEFEPRLMVPLALSYDHRVIDGADGARFITTINGLLSDLRKLVL
ncbi:pyruvate dehydrogenase complex dihydrolipoyllysine-residue acetyltransferase [Motilimonas sp. 1_MG-2023]|uniref:pyruvate dehydrogenase complex dihydrolipoyllysine-residue acetyltransferase n=1 Tax=Motilimonas sp. 1_MG-2023 TaxID=3062672 RepID=UPI0026E2718A|nr:pyruvate dehydrogenase complex dihydrolipoyllysine-residue acetyltransferase [Motilimonas sp. 1_MG-2023]MDO6524229.1 pyruvate dehydrogenase complex dihydrolipoyllysine-residue acetyltransferase [Motilimonas sp. 1_MG-2023]